MCYIVNQCVIFFSDLCLRNPAFTDPVSTMMLISCCFSIAENKGKAATTPSARSISNDINFNNFLHSDTSNASCSKRTRENVLRLQIIREFDIMSHKQRAISCYNKLAHGPHTILHELK